MRTGGVQACARNERQTTAPHIGEREGERMKRMHIHVAVKEIPESIKFYSTMFGVEPSVVKPDYAKWMLDDPRVNFAVSTFGQAATGLDHLGIQVESPDELREIAGRLKAADRPLVDHANAPS